MSSLTKRHRNRTHQHSLSLESLESREMLTVVTEVVADIRPGSTGSSITEVTEFNGELYFSADNGSGSELWKSDGTRDGTQLVREISDGTAGSRPSWFAEYNDELFFAAVTDGDGSELWKSDGTAAGTSLVRDINPGADSSFPSGLVQFNDELYFAAQDGPDDYELWKSDGTSSGTQLVADIREGRSSSPGNASGLVEFGGFLYFNARDNTNGVELWRSDGTVEGTTLVLDADPGGGSSWPTGFFEFQDDLYFIAERFNASEGGFEPLLFRADNDAGTASLVSDVPVDLLQDPFVSGDFIYFAGMSDAAGYELYRTDGTSEGTVFLRDINTGPNSSNAQNFVEFDDKVYFVATEERDVEGTPIYGLWSTDGTAFGTRKVTTLQVYGETTFVTYQDELYFSGRSDEFGWELFKTYGTVDGTVVVEDIAPGVEDSQALPKRTFDGRLLFLAETERDGWEIWSYDGNAVAMHETHQGAGDFTDDPDAFTFVEFGDDLVYVGSNPFDGPELNIIRSTGAPPETPQLAGDADGNGRVEFADFLIVSTNFGKQDASREDGDFDGNGRVDFADFLALSDNFGSSLAARNVDRFFAF